MMRQVIYPKAIAVIKQIPTITNDLFIILFSFKRTITPNPELTNNPANKAPKERCPSANKSVIKILEAQFGINPIIDVYKGAK